MCVEAVLSANVYPYVNFSWKELLLREYQVSCYGDFTRKWVIENYIHAGEFEEISYENDQMEIEASNRPSNLNKVS